MEREKKVIDASIIVKWFLHESGSVEALRLRDDHLNGRIILIIPELAFFEVLNALRYKNSDEKFLASASQIMFDSQLYVEKTSLSLINKIANTALKYELSVYDAAYATLAIMSGISLITADRELLKIPNSVLVENA